MMFDAVSERQGSQLIMYEEEKVPKSEAKLNRFGELTYGDDLQVSSDEDDFGFGFSFDNLREPREQALPFTARLSSIHLNFDSVSDI